MMRNHYSAGWKRGLVAESRRMHVFAVVVAEVLRPAPPNDDARRQPPYDGMRAGTDPADLLTNAIYLFDCVFVGGDGTSPAQSAIPIRILFPPT